MKRREVSQLWSWLNDIAENGKTGMGRRYNSGDQCLNLDERRDKSLMVL